LLYTVDVAGRLLGFSTAAEFRAATDSNEGRVMLCPPVRYTGVVRVPVVVLISILLISAEPDAIYTAALAGVTQHQDWLNGHGGVVIWWPKVDGATVLTRATPFEDFVLTRDTSPTGGVESSPTPTIAPSRWTGGSVLYLAAVDRDPGDTTAYTSDTYTPGHPNTPWALQNSINASVAAYQAALPVYRKFGSWVGYISRPDPPDYEGSNAFAGTTLAGACSSCGATCTYQGLGAFSSAALTAAVAAQIKAFFSIP
jgi:hypothetical protein